MAAIAPREFASKQGAKLRVRTATLEDAPALIACAKRVMAEGRFAVTEAEEFDLTEQQEQDWIQRHLDTPTSLVVVAEVAGQVVGYLDFSCGQRQRIAHRGALAMLVVEECRSVGVGSALLQTLIDWASEQPAVEKLGLAVFANNERAIGLYRKFGFVEEGRRYREIKTGPAEYVDDLLMCRFVDGRDPTSDDSHG